MRSIDTHGLKCLGKEGIGPWLMGEDKLLRSAYLRKPILTLDQARQVFDTYKAAHSTGAPTPAPIEVVRVGKGYGVVVEYVIGVGLYLHFLLGSYSIVGAGADLGRLQRTLHEGHMHGGGNIKALFLGWARAAATRIDAELGARLVDLVAGVPNSDTLLHGDLHLGNVVVSNGKLAPIDMELAGFGDPIFDLAISRSRLFYNAPRDVALLGIPVERAGEYVRSCWRAQLEGYLGDARMARFDEVDLQTNLLAELEFCGLACRMSNIEAQRDAVRDNPQLPEALGRLAALVPQVDSLGIG